MALILVVRFLHIASAIMLVGGIFARQLLRSLAKQTDDVRHFAALSQGAGRVESVMIIPGNLAVIVFGVILAVITGAPIFGFLQGASRNWLLASNILLVVGLLAVPLVFVPRGKKFDLVLQEALAKGQMTPQLRADLEDKTVRGVHLAEMAMLVVVVVLMVFKPF
jgi:uncharacterized membrane protein